MKTHLIVVFTLIFAVSCTQTNMQKSTIKTPSVAKKATEFTNHGDKRTDHYYWLNERENSAVIDYLNAENTYYDKVTAHTKDFQNTLFEEMKARIKKMIRVSPTKKWLFLHYTI